MVKKRAAPYKTCRWKDCQRVPRKGRVLCDIHIAEIEAQSATTLKSFLKALLSGVGIGVAGMRSSKHFGIQSGAVPI
jgi:hypothetical protein